MDKFSSKGNSVNNRTQYVREQVPDCMFRMYTTDCSEWHIPGNTIIEDDATLLGQITADTPAFQGAGSVAIVDEYIYILGFATTKSFIYRKLISSFSNDCLNWEQVAELTPNVAGSKLYYKANTGLLYIIGGNNHTIHIIDLKENVPYTAVDTNKSMALYYGNMLVYGRELYYFGGISSPTDTVVNQITKSTTDNPSNWTTIPGTLPIPLAKSNLVVYNNHAYLLGGTSDGSTALDSIYVADLKNLASWTLSTNKIPRAVYGSTSCIIDNYLYIYGGKSPGYDDKTIMYCSLSDMSTWYISDNSMPVLFSYKYVFFTAE
jgi:N-acetylneuraminic acid mutarotase